MIKSEDILNALGRADEQYILEAAPGQKKKRRIRVYWGTAAALLCLIVSLPFLMLSKKPSETPDKTGDSAPCVMVDGKNYIISPYLSTTGNCPEGFLYGGQINEGFMKGCGYYVSPDIPEWVYVYQDTWENTASDSSTSRKEYVRYVDERIRGKDLICYEGRLCFPAMTRFPPVRLAVTPAPVKFL